MQTGVLYGLWGCAITAFGFAFGGVVDFLGELLSLSWCTGLQKAYVLTSLYVQNIHSKQPLQG